MPIEPPAAVLATYASYPAALRRRILALRDLVLDVAATTPGVGPIEESLKWGEPAFVTAQSKSGSTIRIAWKKSQPTQYMMLFNCQTTLVDSFRTVFPTAFTFAGNRALVFDEHKEVPVAALRICVAMALTYHANSRAKLHANSHAKSHAKKRSKDLK
jgi:Domain of unknown function (DU1801)